MREGHIQLLLQKTILIVDLFSILAKTSNIRNSYCAKTGLKNRGVSYRNDLSGINWSEVPSIYIEIDYKSYRR